MANQWALLIGVNQYTALQPLMYAQADAVALRNFFVDELGIPIAQCNLLTDMSTSIGPYAHYPLRREVEAQLSAFCHEKVQPGDLLWVFFSGYGLVHEGTDYWLTIDTDPLNLEETAISIPTVIELLKTAKTDQILLVLDMNRSQGAMGHQNIGQQTLTLANDFGIATLMSCQPDQYAHETMALRHGLFTNALLEGLRYHGCVTVSQLAAYLSDRVPELSQHHWRPVQNPVAIIPSVRKFMMVVPAEGIAKLPFTESAAAVSSVNTPGFVESSPGLTSQLEPPLPVASNSALEAGPEMSQAVPEAATTLALSDKRAQTGAIVLSPTTISEEKSQQSVISRFWKWGIAALLLAIVAFLIGALFRSRPSFLRGTDTADAPTTDSETTDSETTEVPTALNTSSEVATESAVTSEGEPLFSSSVDPGIAGESALQRAQEAIAAGRYGEARKWLRYVPPELQNETYESLLQQANSEVAEAAVRNQDNLRNARQIIQPLSASSLNDAIEQARQIPPEDPLYEQAQADIARWSRVILDVAEGRAASGDLAGAIAAAGLVPADQPAVYQLTQERIDTWQLQAKNQQLIQQTQNSLQPGQANSFQNAIIALQQITPTQPGYSTAQERINQWSQDILAIARTRAAQGDLDGAIAAAELVPLETVAYDQAQQEIQGWREQG